MAKEILLYGTIYADSATRFIESVNEIGAEDDLTVRVNSEGGDPQYGWGMIAKFKEHTGAKKVKIDGKAYSMGAFYPCYADEVECLDVSEFMLHRAAYPEWVEKNTEIFTPEIKANLERVNTSLRKALEAKVNVEVFEEVTGKKVKDVFSMDQRIDVFFDAKTAKKIGLVDRVIKLTPAKRAELNNYFEIAAKHEEVIETIETETEMNLQELKAKHPEVYAQALEEGVSQERDRVEACLVFNEVDPVAVKAAIESGKPLSQKQVAEFTLKAAQAGVLNKLKTESAETIETEEQETVEKTAKEKELESFEAKVRKELQLN